MKNTQSKSIEELSQMPIASAHWGTYRIEMNDGKPVALHGFEQDPEPSSIGGAMLETLDGPCRIAKPMVRSGFLEHGKASDKTRRGNDSFVAVEWDFALDLAASELTRIRDERGNGGIYAGSYGWASAGRFHHAQSQMRRFLNLFGGFTSSRNTYSYAAAEVIMPHVVGSLNKLLLEHTSWRSIADGAGLVVAFGGMPVRNAQINPGGTGRHSQASDMMAAKKAGVEFVSISPSAPDTMKDLDADWLPIKPNTDMAMMLALAYTLVDEGLHDQAFLEKYCVGFEAFLPYLMGTSDGVPKNAQWAENITGIEASSIITLARRMANTPTTVSVSWSLTRQQNGEQPYWMVVVLAAMLGGIGQPGTGFALGLSAVNSIGSDREHLPWAALPTGKNPVDQFIPVARIADMLLNPGKPFQYDGKEYIYPDIGLIYWAGGNPFHHHQDLNRLRRAWQQVETVIVNEPFWTSLARHADIVFPTTVSLERNDLSGSSRDDYFFATQKATEPFGEARNDHDIFAGLASRLQPLRNSTTDFQEAFTQGRSEDEWLRELYRETKERGENLGYSLPDYDEFREVSFFKLDSPAEPKILLEKFRSNPDNHPLSTPSGRIEIFSEEIAGFNLKNIPGHPVWNEPIEWLGSENADKHPLHLVSHQPTRRLHSQLDQSSYSQAGKIKGREPCNINPSDAAKREIKDGDMVRIFNDRGACLSVARIDASVREGVVMLATGAWYDPDWSNDPNCCKHGNPNSLTADLPTSELAQGPGALTCLVELERFDKTPPEVTAFVPPEISNLE
ncbi:MAG: molybdopterin-dependent oxidoreductase [Rhizobiaceae bacterium]